MKPEGSRIGVIFNGSPLFTGDAGSGESEIRRWVIENDWLECIVQLSDQLFFNTGITTYIWIVNNNKKMILKIKKRVLLLKIIVTHFDKINSKLTIKIQNI
jgi:type I restriction enzyme M protein